MFDPAARFALRGFFEWHVIIFNAKSLPVPYEWADKVKCWNSKKEYVFDTDIDIREWMQGRALVPALLRWVADGEMPKRCPSFVANITTTHVGFEALHG